MPSLPACVYPLYSHYSSTKTHGSLRKHTYISCYHFWKKAIKIVEWGRKLKFTSTLCLGLLLGWNISPINKHIPQSANQSITSIQVVIFGGPCFKFKIKLSCVSDNVFSGNMLFDLFYKLSRLTDSYAQLLRFGHHWKQARLPMTTLWFSGANPITKLFSELTIEADVTDYFICNCWTQVTKLAISTTNFVAKNNTDSMVQILSSNFSWADNCRCYTLLHM